MRDVPSGPVGPGIAAGAAALLIGSLFLPWFTPDVGPPFSPESTSGWSGTPGLAKIVLALAAVTLLADGALALAGADRLALDEGLERALAWAAAAAAGAALVLVAYRVLVLPDPAEFLSRAIGMYVALAAAAVATALSVAGALARGAPSARR